MSIERLKWAAILSFVISLLVLIGGGLLARKELPPYPEKVLSTDGKVLFGRGDILNGQNVFQRYGLMDHGSVWGHGSQRGPEFSATSLRIMSEAAAEVIALKEYGKAYGALEETRKEFIDVLRVKDLRTNRYNPVNDTLVLSPAQQSALERIQKHWEDTFKDGDVRYSLLPFTIPSAEERLQISRFFFWTAWVASTNRPGEDYTYTNNWPADRSVGNVPTLGTYVWTLGGILGLLVVLGIFIFCVHYYGLWFGPAGGIPLAQKLVDAPLTSSQFKAAKFFLVVVLLFVVQTNFGGLLAHYTIHPASFWFPFVAEFSLTAGRKPGTCSWPSSGSPPPGSELPSTLHPSLVAGNPPGRAS